MRKFAEANISNIKTPTGPLSETKDYDIAILISWGCGIAVLAVVGYAMAVGLGVEHGILESLPVVMP